MDYITQNVDEAKRRYEKYKSLDPFPEIKPALLNRADIMDYIAATGMICPFDHDNLKPASYALKLGGFCIQFDENGEKQEIDITEGKEFILKSNSISFVSVSGFFQFPYYIAGRFNLRINNVYRGLLLGTGPLVDPGFVGNLSFPLHNLTLNDYTIRYNDNMIWMEFTKLSENQSWIRKSTKDILKRQGVYEPNVRFEKRGLWKVGDYITDAEPQRIVRSSIPEEMKINLEAANKAKSDAEKARKIAEDMERKERKFNFIIAIVIGISLVAIFVSVICLYLDTRKFVYETEQRINKNVSDNNKMQIENTNSKISDIDKRILELEKKIESENKSNTKDEK